MKNIIIKLKNKKAFTMLEILMITLIVGIGLLSIVVAISKAKVITNNTKQHIIATQLAKEGIEMVYQIRNTNLLKHSNDKDHCRLNENPTEDCNDSTTPNRMTKKNYILSGQILSGTNNILNIGDGTDTGDLIFGLCLTGGQRIACHGSDNQTQYGKFFRTIEGKGLFLKNSPLTGGKLISCSSGSIANCNNKTAKEFRFCSRVEYIGTKTGNVEICGIMTNFFD